jgi:hypothetical protein
VVTLGTKNWWLYKSDGHLGQIVLTTTAMCLRGPETDWLHKTDGRQRELAFRTDVTINNYNLISYFVSRPSTI